MRLNKRHKQIIPVYRKRQNSDFTGRGREKNFFFFLVIKKKYLGRTENLGSVGR